MICIFKIQADSLLYLRLIYTSLMAGLKKVIEKPAWGEAAICLCLCSEGLNMKLASSSFYSCGNKYQVSHSLQNMQNVLSPQSLQTAPKKAQLHVMS